MSGSRLLGQKWIATWKYYANPFNVFTCLLEKLPETDNILFFLWENHRISFSRRTKSISCKKKRYSITISVYLCWKCENLRDRGPSTKQLLLDKRWFWQSDTYKWYGPVWLFLTTPNAHSWINNVNNFWLTFNHLQNLIFFYFGIFLTFSNPLPITSL